MSGDPVRFLSPGPSSFALTAVRALADLPPDLPPWALVGGVAVSINLAGLHRPTADLDSVSVDGDRTVEMLIDRGAAASRNGVTIPVDGTTLGFDVIDVSMGDDQHGSFLAHRLALDTAGSRHISVTDPNGLALAEAVIPVSSPSALVAMKLHAIAGRRAARPDKRSGDVYDIVRLTLSYGPETIATELRASGRRPLLTSVARLVEVYFDAEAARSLRWLRSDSRSALMSEIDREDLRIVAEIAGNLLDPD